MLAHLADEEGNLAIFLRGLVPFRMGLFDDADEDPQVGIALLGCFELGDGAGKKLGVSANLPVYYFGFVMHTTWRAQMGTARLWVEVFWVCLDPA